MKIIEKGNLNEIKLKCPKCNCKFIVDDRDMRFIKVDNRGIETIIYCPYCGFEVDENKDILRGDRNE